MVPAEELHHRRDVLKQAGSAVIRREVRTVDSILLRRFRRNLTDTSMPKSRTLFGRPHETSLVTVDRAIAEFRAGRPVLLRAGEKLALALSAELMDADLSRNLDALALGNAHLVLSAARLRRLGAKGRSETGIFAMPTIDVARVEMLALKTDAKVDAPVAPADDIYDAAL